MSDDGDTEGGVDVLRISREEAQRTLDNQLQTLSDIDDKAARILRINLVLLSIILTGVSIAANSDGSPPAESVLPALVNNYTIAGIVLLIFSTAVAAITYTSSDVRGGMSGEALRSILDNDFNDRENLEGIVESYARWIEHNYRTNVRNAPLGTLTLLLLLYALAALALGAKEAVGGGVSYSLVLATLGLLALLTWLTRFHWQLQRWYRSWASRRGEN